MSRGLVWITGASSGIGAAFAVEMADHGWQVAASGRDRERLDTLVASRPEAIHGYELEVTDEAACRAVAARIETELGAIDIAVFNAGISQPVRADTFDGDAARRMMRVNYEGAVNGIAAVLAGMRERGRGRLVLTASLAGYRGLPGGGAYGATKAAMITLAEGLKLDLRASGIDVSVVTPGFVRTPLTRKNRFPMPLIMTPEAAARRMRRGIEAGRFEITFPRRLAFVMKCLQRLPYVLYFAIMRRIG